MNPNTKLVGQLATAVLAMVLFSGSAFAGTKSQKTIGIPVDVPVQSPSFESPVLQPGQWTIDTLSPGWNLLPGSVAGVWYPLADNYIGTPWDGKNVLYINYGGVSQDLGINLQSPADYSFSMEWGNRLDMTDTYISLQLVADGKVLASCAPPYSPAPGTTATVTVVYHSNGSRSSVGQPLSIQVLKLKKVSDSTSVNPDWGTQVNLDDAEVTFTDRAGTPASAFTNTQECSINIAR
jgi:HpiC1 cyclase